MYQPKATWTERGRGTFTTCSVCNRLLYAEHADPENGGCIEGPRHEFQGKLYQCRDYARLVNAAEQAELAKLTAPTETP